MNDKNLTLLSEGQIFGNDQESQLEVMRKYGSMAAITDLCILTGGHLWGNTIDEDSSLKGRTSNFWTKTNNNKGNVRGVDVEGRIFNIYMVLRDGAIRPVLDSPEIFSQILSNKKVGYNGTYEVEYGEYPQYAVSLSMQDILETEYNRGMKKTGKTYTFDSVRCNDICEAFQPVTYDEYEYKDKKYIRIRANSSFDYENFLLSNGAFYRDDFYVWVEVSPVKWLIDPETKLLISKLCLVSGIRFHDKNKVYEGDFSKTKMKEYLDRYMIHDLTQNESLTSSKNDNEEEKVNPYNFNLSKVSEEEIIKGAIESGVAVFLHGPSSEGKSARVKEIDPTCEIIYLANASVDSLIGKSVYNQSTGEMIDVKPSWLKKLEAKCKNEPDRLHILFLDEITHALPSVQGLAFNIVLDREVNGIWKLPENARVVAAGNEVKDSMAANQIAEPLFNRFAHVYIKTTTENWLKWASEHNIHPAIYSYIAYKNGVPLRSEYNGEKPNADPRKWEMASKMLYATGKPEMLRALVGEDITKEFVQFCNQKIIALEDVLNDNYTNGDIEELSRAEKFATTMELIRVDDNNLEKAREFARKLGAEFVSIFDVLWTRGDESKLERLAEAKLTEVSKRSY